ncbi:MAG: radical SAM protein [Deltaproteobacteria bacterium]|nr:radical SAM protein [Deltaproteobacteria bacterium]
MIIRKNKPIQKILIVIPPMKPIDYGHGYAHKVNYMLSPVEPLSLAAMLINQGYDVRILDTGLHQNEMLTNTSEVISDYQPDAFVLANQLISFQIDDWDGEPLFSTAKAMDPEIITITTGTFATNFPERCMKLNAIDYGLRGETDETLCRLIDALNQNQSIDDIPGLFYRSNGDSFLSGAFPTININDLPMPATHLIERSCYWSFPEYGKIRYPEKSHKYWDIQTSRGCIHHCHFCCVGFLRGEQKWRRKSLDRIMEEVESALDDGVEEIHFIDDFFTATPKQIINFCDKIKSRNLRFHWFVAQGMPLHPLNEKALEAMVKNGMYRLIAPFESGNQSVLTNLYGKKLTLAHSRNVAKWAKSLDIELVGAFVIGYPGETREQLFQTVDLAEELDPDYVIFSIATPLIGTKLYKTAMDNGLLPNGYESVEKIVKRTQGVMENAGISNAVLAKVRYGEWDRINFSSQEKIEKYARMVGLTVNEVEAQRKLTRRSLAQLLKNYE